MRRKLETKRSAPARSSRALRLGQHHTVELTPAGDRAILRVVDADARADLELEIFVTAAGPSVRVRARSVELETTGDVALRCEAFQVDARAGIALRAGGTASLDAHAVKIEARVGAAVVQANDDVQLLGEQVLLNCDRQPPMPPWVQPGAPPEPVPIAATSGDAALLATLQREST